MIIVRDLETRAWGWEVLKSERYVHMKRTQIRMVRIIASGFCLIKGCSLGPQCCYGYLVTVALISSSSFCTRILKSWFRMMGRKLMIEWILSTFSKFCSELIGKTQMNRQEVVQHSLQFSGLWHNHVITVARLYLTTHFPSSLWQKVWVMLKGFCLISNGKYILIVNYFCFG